MGSEREDIVRPQWRDDVKRGFSPNETANMLYGDIYCRFCVEQLMSLF